jgi:hypothetical protein
VASGALRRDFADAACGAGGRAPVTLRHAFPYAAPKRVQEITRTDLRWKGAKNAALYMYEIDELARPPLRIAAQEVGNDRNSGGTGGDDFRRTLEGNPTDGDHGLPPS